MFMTFIIRFIFYVIAIVGLWIIIRPMIDRSLKDMAKHMDYRMKMKAKLLGLRTNHLKHKFKLYRHIDDLLYIAKAGYEPGLSTVRFMVWNVFLFLCVLVVSYLTFGELPNQITFNNPFTSGIQMDKISSGLTWQFPFIFSIIISSIPYFRLQYKYSIKKVQSSYDLLEVVQIFTKFSNLSIDAALDKTANLLSQGNVLLQPLKILSNTFSTYSTDQELRHEIRRFNHTVNTTFSLQYTSDLLYAEREGSHFLRESLTNLKEEMEQQRGNILSVKSNSRDAIQMGVWGNLLVLVLCSGSMASFVKPDVYLRLQFQTKTGLVFITLILIGLFISFLISYVLSRPKLDYK